MAEDAPGAPSELRAMHGPVRPLAVDKAMPRLDRCWRAFVELSPFLVPDTSDGTGSQDVSTRGTPAE